MTRVGVVSFEFSPFPGGHGTYATEMALGLHCAGASTRVLAPRYGDLTGEPLPFSVTRPFEHQTLNLDAVLATRRWLLEGRPDEIILACDIRAALAVQLGTLGSARRRTVAMFHGSEVLKSERSPLARWANKFAYRSAEALVANSQYTSSLVSKRLNRHCDVALLGVSDYWLQNADGPFASPVLRQLPDDALVVATVARLEPRKGHLDALEAIARLGSQRANNLVYVVAGRVIDEDYAKEVFGLAKQLGPKFVYTGPISRSDVRRLYARSLCHILAARAEPETIEGFGLATLEAAAQGCPSVVTEVGGLPEAVIDGQTGFVVPEGDIAALADALALLLRRPELRARLSANARAHARENRWLSTIRRTPMLKDLVTEVA